MDLKDVKDGANYKSIWNSRNLDIIMTKQYWENGKVIIADNKTGLCCNARINGTILIDVGEIKPRKDGEREWLRKNLRS